MTRKLRGPLRASPLRAEERAARREYEDATLALNGKLTSDRWYAALQNLRRLTDALKQLGVGAVSEPPPKRCWAKQRDFRGRLNRCDEVTVSPGAQKAHDDRVDRQIRKIERECKLEAAR